MSRWQVGHAPAQVGLPRCLLGKDVLTGALPQQSGKWAVTPMPSWDGKPASGVLGGSTFAVTKGGEKTEAAVEFATWMTTTEDGIEARIASGASSAFPAAAGLRPAAQAAFDAKYYGGQDIYQVFGDAGASITPDWAWVSSTGTTNTVIKGGFGKVANGGGVVT